MQETQEMQFPPLGGEDPVEEEMTTHSSIRAWKIPWKSSLGRYSLWVHKESDRTDHTHRVGKKLEGPTLHLVI